MTIILTLYIFIMCGLAIYLLRLFWLSVYARIENRIELPHIAESDLPLATVQLPICNEKYVAVALIDAACALDYPRNRLQIQVLDDSTGDTTTLIARAVQRWQEAGINISHLRRAVRYGHKAGNLANALPYATGEFIAIFDADFLPNPAWLRRTIAHFFRPGCDRLGLVQTRWNHVNAHESLLTYAQMLTYEDFGIAQATRTRLGLWSSFYGSAGLWRRTCIEDAGGWSADTLTEDLDLAFQAQLAGWQIGYDDISLASAELPGQMLAYKQQQFLWSKGNTQVARKFLGQLLRASFSPLQKLDALLFATWPLTHALLVFLLLFKLPQLIWPAPVVFYLDALALFALAGMMAPSLVDGLRGKNSFPLHVGLQIGVALNNTYGLLAGLFSPPGAEFRAVTPKSGASGQQQSGQVAPTWGLAGELLLMLIALAGFLLAIRHQQWLALPVLLVYLLGIGWVGGQSLWEALQWYVVKYRVA